jgi:hypothetical protein
MNTSHPVTQASSSQTKAPTARKQQKRRHHDTHEEDPRLTASTSLSILPTSTPATSTLLPPTRIPAARSCPSALSELHSSGNVTAKKTRTLSTDPQRSERLNAYALPSSAIPSPSRREMRQLESVIAFHRRVQQELDL